jgi:transcriptional regulator with XRE-family HTH domain
MNVGGQLIGAARRYRGVSGRALAAQTQSSQTALSELERGEEDATSARLDRLLRPLGYQLSVIPSRLGTAVEAAEGVREHLLDRNEERAKRSVWQLAADLQDADPALRVALCITPPAPTTSPRYDALIAAVCDYLLTDSHLPIPTWVHEPWRTLDTPWDVESVPSLRKRARELTPTVIGSHGVFLNPGELMNA